MNDKKWRGCEPSADQLKELVERQIDELEGKDRLINKLLIDFEFIANWSVHGVALGVAGDEAVQIANDALAYAKAQGYG